MFKNSYNPLKIKDKIDRLNKFNKTFNITNIYLI